MTILIPTENQETLRKDLTPNLSENDTPSDSAHVQYFAKQKKIFPREVKGYFRHLKWIVMFLTLGFYYLAPFIRWDRGPNAPDQAILIDLPHARAYWFFIEIWPHEVYILSGILILSAILLFFITSLFGRVWCGYFCPQTVWTDLFIWVETVIQGDRGARKRLHDGPWSIEKIWKIGVTHILWLAIAWWTAGSFVLYFNDAPTLVRSFFEFNVSSTVLAFMGGLTFSTYLMAGFAREQVCTYMCPYARFQSAMFDLDTLVIGYDAQRGEPRGRYKKGDVFEGRGHCIDCSACVQVCPMGIDIRNGLQMECIACGLCIDACDEIMDKVGLPRGLVRYDTDRHIKDEKRGGDTQFRLLRPRTIYYTLLLALVGGVMLYALMARAPYELHILHDRAPLFVQLSSGEIRNGYDIHILNKTHDAALFSLEVTGIQSSKMEIKAAGDVHSDSLLVPADDVGHFRVLLFGAAGPNRSHEVTFRLRDKMGDVVAEYGSVFISQGK